MTSAPWNPVGAAFHATAIQGGFSTPGREAWRILSDLMRVVMAGHAFNAEQAAGALATLHWIDTNAGDPELIADRADFEARFPQWRDALSTAARDALSTAAREAQHQLPADLAFAGAPPSPFLPASFRDTTAAESTGYGLVQITAERNERLSQLVARYDAAKSAAKAAADELKAITDGIKAELTAARPGAEIIDVVSPDLALPLRLQAVESWRVDARRLKAEQPTLYVAYAKPSTAWRLEAIKDA